MLRRVHSLEKLEIVKILSAYGHLVRQRKVGGSQSLLKTIEYVLQNKWNQFSEEQDGINMQMRVLNTFYEISSIKNK
jgi:hypothetical protein